MVIKGIKRLDSIKRLSLIIIANVSCLILFHSLLGLNIQRLNKLGTSIDVKIKYVCRDVFEIRYPNPNCISNWTNLAIEFIRDSKENREFITEDGYKVLGYEGLNLARELIGQINGTNITRTNETLIDKLNWELPYLPCKLKKYQAEDFGSCTMQRLSLGIQTRITYIGDSRVRQQMEVLLDLLASYDLNIYTSSGENITVEDLIGFKGSSEWTKYKDRLKATSKVLPGLIITFYWAPNLSEENEKYMDSEPFTKVGNLHPFKNSSIDAESSSSNSSHQKTYQQNYETGAFNVLKHMATKSAEEVDDFILLGGGAWHMQSKVGDVLYNIDAHSVHGMTKLYSFLDTLSEKTTVVFILPEPFKEYAFNTKNSFHNYYSEQKNDNFQWHLNAFAQLMPPKVIIWDTFLPVAYAAIKDCIDLLASNDSDISSLPRYSRFSAFESYSCHERIHLGFRNIYTGVQLLLNHLCNRVMVREQENYCCIES